jgi:hypothetical protein
MHYLGMGALERAVASSRLGMLLGIAALVVAVTVLLAAALLLTLAIVSHHSRSDVHLPDPMRTFAIRDAFAGAECARLRSYIVASLPNEARSTA